MEAYNGSFATILFVVEIELDIFLLKQLKAAETQKVSISIAKT